MQSVTGLTAVDPPAPLSHERSTTLECVDAPRELTYRPDIDGLRAVAVVAVILYHARVPGFEGGYVGVDIFFVISGYLITQLLTAAFAPTRLEVINDSASHHGHAGHDGSGESHFTVEIESAVFAGVSRLERQRMVNRALGDIPGQRVHALAIKAKAPGE